MFRKDPFEVLMLEHQECIKRLKQLDRAADRIRSDGFSAEEFSVIVDVLGFIDTNLRHHNEKEEKYLFNFVENHINGSSELVKNEHRELWKEFDRLTKIVHDIEDGRFHGSSIVELVNTSKYIVMLMISHIDNENKVFFPRARNVLTKNELQYFTAAIAAGN